MSNFNGQINISRDLRQNKQVVIGKYDLTDIIFLVLGVATAITVAYILGFSAINIVDEFTAIIISIAPMILIISFGFKRVAGIRKINFLRMKTIDKKSKYRLKMNANNIQAGERYLVGLQVDRKYVNKYINKFLSYENLAVLSVRYVREIETNKRKIYFILDLRYKKDESIFEDILNKFTINNDIKVISVNDILKLEENNIRNQKVFMLNIYDVKIYRSFISKVKLHSEVICYFKKVGKIKYVNTFLAVKEEAKIGKKLTKLEKVEKLCIEYGIILDRLNRDQNAGKAAISYLLTNPLNAYRKYK